MRNVFIALVAGSVVAGAAVVPFAYDWKASRASGLRRAPLQAVHTDHAALISGPLSDGPSVTRACLGCHPDTAHEVMATSHWTWAGQEVKLPGRPEAAAYGKKNLINNFCIHAAPNLAKCVSCHAGYGWSDDKFDFSNQENVDCLICHEQTGTYRKGLAGQPEEGVDLLAVARSVARPTRMNCGQCHFQGGGGDAVKHGDLDGSMYFPGERIDVHMGRHNFQCVDCHQAREHRIPGYVMSVYANHRPRLACDGCHGPSPHKNQRLDGHARTVACETCHIPRMAIDAPTKIYWDWSEAGQSGRKQDPHVYLKEKGSFQFAQNVRPEYYWYNGQAYRYLSGDKIAPGNVVRINAPLGGPTDPSAKIWPFKVHRGKQPYDTQLKHLLTPQTWGPGGYWSDFDWDKACRLGAKATGVPYSGHYGFVETVMYWPLSHMVQPKERALQCIECHSPDGIMDWRQLGFEGDPAFRGDRHRLELIRGEIGGSR